MSFSSFSKDFNANMYTSGLRRDFMKILHTSDWHIGKRLADRERRGFVSEEVHAVFGKKRRGGTQTNAVVVISADQNA